jgi:hypothetical protein
MNQQIPGYSAVYSAPGPCVPCQQAGMYHNANNAMTVQMPGSAKADSPQAGSAVQSGSAVGTMPTGTIPSAIQQPGIQNMVLGAEPSGSAQAAQSIPSTAQMMPITDTTRPAPMTADSLEFLNGFLRTQIGRRVRIEFLIGTNTFTDKSGLLIGVGANYILLREASTDDILTCDFFNIKFVTIYY